ncbi:hypothetical protein [Lysinibacillus sphaericus]|nr:hypothetical protein [Lysinibacillus sphaericus]
MNKQQLNVTLSIPIPEDMILIKKVELEELQQDRLIESLLDNERFRKPYW